MSDNFRVDIQNILKRIPNQKLKAVQDLWPELNYDPANGRISERNWSESEREALAESPCVIATAASNADFKVIYCRLNTPQLRLSPQRPIINRLLQDNPYSLFVFSNADQTDWHLVNVKYEAPHPSPLPGGEGSSRRVFRRIRLGQRDGLRTAIERLSLLDVDSLPREMFGVSPLTLQQRHDEAFDVEAVTKEFYREVAGLFTDLVGGERKEGKQTIQGRSLLKLPSTVDDQTRKEFAVRLIGRLLFCWFLRKKLSDSGEALIPDTVLSLAAVQSKQSLGVYHSLLEPLFFETLNKQLADRQAEFQQGAWAKIPFLNGGLFEAHADDFYDPKGSENPLGHSSYVNTLVVPDSWLIELIALFERFNFTLHESTPLDIEVAVDPEMLGKIFENLLAEINPETGESARKATGSYYTPRPIVEYMVDESLKQYLRSAAPMPLSDADLADLFSYHQPRNPFDGAITTRLIQAIDELKILDPACGSGAFPMGVLQKVLLLLQKLDPNNVKWKGRQLDKARELSDPTTRAQATAMIERAFANKQLDYGRKLFLIQNCIYGVDIQSIAVEIAKLRCFLSLVIDEHIDENLDNRGIMALPNLEFKFICANTLIGLSQTKQFADSLAAAEIKELKAIAADYLTSYGAEKARLKGEFKRVQQEMGHKLSSWTGQAEAVQLLNWQPFEHEACGWFDPALMLGVKEGFDVVIGNPPYSRVQSLQQSQPQNVEYFKKNYISAKGSFDIYVIFIEKGFSFLKSSGVFSYIVPHKFFQAQFGEAIRQFLTQRKALMQIVRFGAEQVFEEASNYTCLLFLSPQPQSQFNFYEVKSLINSTETFQAIQWQQPHPSYNSGLIQAPQSNVWNFTIGGVDTVLQKLRQQSHTLGDIIRKIFQGIATSADKIYVLPIVAWQEKTVRCFSNVLNREVELELGLVKPFLMGKNIHRYEHVSAKNVVIFPYTIEYGKAMLMSQSFIRENFPLGWQYLLENKQALSERENGKMQGEKFYAYIYPKNLTEFDAIKIMTPEIALGCQMSFDLEGIFYHTTKIYSFVFNQNLKDSPKYLLGILNSKVLWFFLSSTGYVLRGGYFTFKTEYLKPFPIPCSLSKNPPTQSQHDHMVAMVDQILAAKRANPKADTSALEREIDKLVYALYGLTAAEVALVEGGSNE